jgi:hypothetical protein
MLAAIASQTILHQLGSAFWQAFTSHSSSNEANPNAAVTWEADKIQRVLEGKAVVRIVDIEPEVKVGAAIASPPTQTLPDDSKTHECSKGCNLTTVLEEGMCALSLSKE